MNKRGKTRKMINALELQPIASLWFNIGIIIIVAAVIALIARFFKQHSIPAYIIGGIIIGPIGLGLIKNTEVITVLSEIGIAFLLFFAGLEISFKKVKHVGKVATISGAVQIVAVSAITFIIALLFSFSVPEAIFIALAISFSSTAIVVKLLADKNELNTLHARIIIGILLVQDIAAIIALTLLSATTISVSTMTGPFIKISALALFAFILRKTILLPVFTFAARSSELLFLTSIAICFLFNLLALLPIAGLPSLSIVIGSFIAGILLANSPFKTEIESKILPLRDFFVTIFFVSTGLQLVFSNFVDYILPFICFLFIAIVIKPYILMALVKLSGYTKKTSFYTGFFQAQTSEFSLILMAQGLVLGHVTQASFSMIVFITVLTMSITPFLISKDHFFFGKLSRILNTLKHIPEKEETEYITKTKKDIVLIGCHRTGSVFLRAFSKVNDRIMIIDANPEITKELTKQKFSNIYGDITDPDIINKIGIKDMHLILSTIPDKMDNLYIIEKVKKENPKAIVFVTADFINDALELYRKGADYVMLPQITAGERCVTLLKEIIEKKEDVSKIKEEHVKYLKELNSIM